MRFTRKMWAEAALIKLIMLIYKSLNNHKWWQLLVHRSSYVTLQPHRWQGWIFCSVNIYKCFFKAPQKIDMKRFLCTYGNYMILNPNLGYFPQTCEDPRCYKDQSSGKNDASGSEYSEIWRILIRKSPVTVAAPPACVSSRAGNEPSRSLKLLTHKM